MIATEWERLKVVPLDKIEHTQDLTKYLKKPEGKQTLRPIQNEMLWQAIDRKGLLGFVACGEGKTLVSMLLPTVLRSERPLLLLPAFMITQHLSDRQAYGQHWDFKDMKVLSYETLSSPKRLKELEEYAPDLIICDEAHCLRNLKSARVRRLDNYMIKFMPKFCALSGTLVARSISDYSHLASWALGVYSPIPRIAQIVQEWCLCIEEGLPSKLVSNIVKGGSKDEYLARLQRSKGIVITKSQEVGASLIINKEKISMPTSLKKSIAIAMSTGDIVSATNEILDNEQLEAMFQSSDLWTPKDSFMLRVWGQISCGFVYTWDWENREIDQQWIEYKRAWGRASFQMLERSSFDSVSLISQYAETPQAPKSLAIAWQNWKSVKDREPPKTKAIWLDTYLIDFVKKWTLEQSEPVLIWCAYSALAHKLKEALNCEMYGAGDEDAKRLDTNKHIAHTAIMSIQAHGTGKNLQSWHNQIIVHPLAHPSTWEQLLARTHRPGQLADEVHMSILNMGLFAKAFNKALKDAQYIQDTTGQKQRLIYATKNNK
jgi:hypothetical protein